MPLAEKTRVLMLIPSYIRRDIDEAVRNDQHPMMDYHALQRKLGADLMDYADAESVKHPLVRLLRRAGRDAQLAAAAYLRRSHYDCIFSNGENVSIPLALLMGRTNRRPGHILIGHRLSTPKKRPLLKALHAQMDAIFLYSSVQLRFAEEELGIPKSKLHLIPFHADHRFYRPYPRSTVAHRAMICSAGLEWRDYPTLIEAVRGLDVEVRLAAASPWSKHKNETENRVLPNNVSARRYDYAELRLLYAGARFVVAPLYENDFQAGITTILEAMAMGKAVIATRTTGQVDAIRHEFNGLYVPVADAETLRSTIVRLLDQPEAAERLGRQARQDIEAAMTLDHWVERISRVITMSARRGGAP